MKTKGLKTMALILAIGLALSLAAYLLTAMVKQPTVTQHDFPFSVTYRLKGETKTLEGIYRVRFQYTGRGTDPQARYYEGEHLSNPTEGYCSEYIIAEQDEFRLCIAVTFSNTYLMGDADILEPLYDPELYILDEDSVAYYDQALLDSFDAELLDWTYPTPVDNSFRFVRFSYLNSRSMLAMLLVGILSMIACGILVKRDKTVPYKVLDKISIALNFLVAIFAIPFMTLVTLLMQIYVSGDELAYQLSLLLPALTAFTIAASISLRRIGLTKTGFFISFVGPGMFVLSLLLE